MLCNVHFSSLINITTNDVSVSKDSPFSVIEIAHFAASWDCFTVGLGVLPWLSSAVT